MRKNGQGKVDDFKRHFLIFRCWLTSITGLFPSYWRGKFLVFFPRNLSTSSSGDDRPQYAAIFAEEVFVSSSSRSPLKNTTKSNDRWDARRTDFTELWRRESAHSDCNAGLECIELRRWRRRRHHRFFSAIALEKIFFLFLGSPTRCDRARNEKNIFPKQPNIWPQSPIISLLARTQDIVSSTWSSSYYFAVAQFVDLLTDRYTWWMPRIIHERIKKTSQPRNIGGKKKFLFFLFLLVFLSLQITLRDNRIKIWKHCPPNPTVWLDQSSGRSITNDANRQEWKTIETRQ